ncbi:TonB-dependent siderophore receptor [Arcicella sp. LKC2W]|uniref:TonB-dependent siderophore receptor n=1 Tax=Arcicella sp. LKC2W TaxID=2984198 RepID=UPI002B1EF8A5|nr:TonB-dependent siderophore receptor [Arcicella sp. LKC2W]MEA5461859.1 TonB-dependent siderophore receptor [Arcicella sp. LKC2W]
MKLIFTILIILFSVVLHAQNASVSGIVAVADGKSAEFINVQLKGAKRGTITDSEGKFKIDNLNAGAHTLIFSGVGFDTQEIKFQVRTDVDKILEKIIIKENTRNLNEVIVSGQKSEKYIADVPSQSLRLAAPLIEIPQNISVATRQTIIDMGMLNKNDVIRAVSGITKTYGDDLDASLLIRGTNATYSTYRNGVGGPIWWNAQEDASMIERVEFVKGPAGFMLANAEPGGLVNTVTKQPTHERINEVSFGMGSYNMMRTTVDLGGEFTEGGKLTYRLNTGFQQSAKFYKLSNFNRFFVCPALKYDFTDKSSITLEHNYVKAVSAHNAYNQISINEQFYALPYNMAMNDPNIGNFLGADVYTRLAFNHQINEQWKLNAQVAYMTTDWDGMALYVNGLSATKDTIYRTNSSSDWYGKLYNMQVFADGKFNTGNAVEHKVLIGLDFGDGGEGSTYGGDWSNAKRLQLSIKNPIYYVPKDSLTAFPAENKGSWMATNKWQALYVQDHIKIAKKYIVTLAGRFTMLTTGQDYNGGVDDPEYEITENAFTPRVGLTYLPSDKLSIFAIYDQSFLPQRGAVFGGSRLPPLTGSNKEIGIKALLFNKKLSLNASVYSIEKNNVSTTDPIHDGFYLQTGQIKSEGFEMDLIGNITNNLSVIANYSYTNARVTKDLDSTVVGIKNYGTPDQTMNAWLKYKFSEGLLKGLSFGAGVQHMGNRSGVYVGWGSEFGNKNLPTYTIYDACVNYNFSKISIGLNVYNLANQKYVSNGYYSPDAQEWVYSPGTPINFRLQTTIKF